MSILGSTALSRIFGNLYQTMLEPTSEEPEVASVTELVSSLAFSCLQADVDQSKIPKLLKQNRSVSAIEFTLITNDPVEFSWFEKLEALQSLALLGTTGFSLLPGIRVALPALTSLVVSNAHIDNIFIMTIAELPLKRLSLRNCKIQTPCLLTTLEKCQTLEYLNLEGTVIKNELPSVMLGQIHLLAKALPKTGILPKDSIFTYTDYNQVLSPEKVLGYSYAFDELQKPDNLYPLLAIGADEENHWETWGYSRDNVYAHNRCEHLGRASPIKCPDGRVRLAGKEPGNNSTAFWHYVYGHAVTVIVMVMDFYHHYFPKEVGDSMKFGFPEVRVECIKKKYYKKTDHTLRVFKVNDQIVHHLHINWGGYLGIEIERLAPFLQKVQKSEKVNHGKTYVHCQQGVGRTGTFFACMILEQLLRNIDKSQKLYFNLQVLLLALRQQRPCMIESVEQLDTTRQFLAYLK